MLCTVYSALSTLHCLLCSIYSVLSALHCLLYAVYSAMSTLHCLLCTVYCELYALHCLLCIVYSAVSTLPCSAGTFDLLVYTDATSDVPQEWEDSDPRFIQNAADVKLRSFTTKVSTCL